MEMREEMQKMHTDMKGKIRENRMQVKENRDMFREEHQDMFETIKDSLSDVEQKALEKLHESMKDDMEALREKMEDAKTTEEKESLHTEMEALADLHHTAIKNLLGDNPEALALLEQRKEVYEANEILRQENRDIRKEYGNVKREMVEKYRKNFIQRLKGKIEVIPEEKLEEIARKIDTMIERNAANESISSEKKEAMLAALIALKEIIEEKIEGDMVEDEILETIEDLLH